MARRRTNTPAFGSDSFLDVVANLVGIVLIIIVLVGARVRSLPEIPTKPPPGGITAVVTPPPFDAGAADEELTRLRSELAALRAELLATLRAMEAETKEKQHVDSERAETERRRDQTATDIARVRRELAMTETEVASTESDVRSLRERLAALQRSIADLPKPQPQRRFLTYYLPISRPLGAGELLFELREGRVTFIDLQSMLDEARRNLPAKSKQLVDRWEVTDTVGPFGAFQLKYTVERETSAVERALGGPPSSGSYKYGVTSWEVVPIWQVRGETVQEALRPRSRFLDIVEASDPETAAFTFFVYPDSFELFRTLREELYRRGFTVAARPLQAGRAISGSRNGSISRGQ